MIKTNPRKSPSLVLTGMRTLLFLFVTCFFNLQVLGQSTANYAFSTTTTGSLALDANGNTVDLSSGTTALVPAASDQGVSSVTNIGFNFIFMGNPYTQFTTSANGVVQLGATAVSGSTYVASGGTVAAPKLGAFTGDMITASVVDGGGVVSKLVGTAPNRCLVIQWVNYTYWGNTTPAATWQMRLYETGIVEYVYGAMVQGVTSATGYTTGFSVGTATNTLASVTTSTNGNSVSAFATNTYTTSTAVANLNSASNGSRRVYKYTPPASPSAATGLNFTAITGSTMTLNWTDNATTETGYAIYRSIDNVNFTFVATTAASATSYAASSLGFGITYYWNVVAVNEGAASAALTGSQATNAPSFTGGATAGIVTVGTLGDYNNLTTAFAAINAAGLANSVDIQLIAGYPAVGETYPIVSSTALATGAFNIRVYPTVSGLSITSNNATGTLNLNNAANLTFDGRINATGSTKSLVISNTNAGASYAVQFINDASNSTIKYCTIQSRNNSTTSGTVVFSTTTGSNGNDGNTIDNCDIRDDSSNPLNGIYALGTTTTTAQYNDNNTISNCNIYNFFSAASATNGILISGGNSGWTVTGNSVYQTASRTYTTGATHTGINISSATAGNNFTVNNNFIGGTAPNAGSTAYTMAGAVTTLFRGITLNVASTVVSNIQGNTIANISLTTSSSTTTMPGFFSGINISAGLVNAGTVTGNTIGAATGTGSINLISTSTGGVFSGIYGTSSATLDIRNNNIGSISTGSAAAIGHVFYGVYVAGSGSHNVTLNNIGSSTTSNSITIGTSGVTTAITSLTGIYNVSSGTTINLNSNSVYNTAIFGSSTSSTFTGVTNNSSTTGVTINLNSNIVRNNSLVSGIFHGVYENNQTFSNSLTVNLNSNQVNNNTAAGTGATTMYGVRSYYGVYTINSNQVNNLSVTATAAATTSSVYGIYASGSPTNETVTNNQVNTLSIAGASTSTSSVLAGIYLSTTSGTRTASGNTVSGLTYTNSSTGGSSVYGIYSGSSSSNIFKNKFYDLTATNGASSLVYGIYSVSGATNNIYNNFVGNLNANASSLTAPAPSVVGLYISGGTTLNAYYNTIYLNATSTGANFSTAAVYSSATPTTVNLRNNIFTNISTPGASGRTVAFQRSAAALTNYATTSNNNLFYAGTPSATRLLYYDGTNSDQTLGAYKIRMSTRDQLAISEAAVFVSTTGSNANFLHINTATGTQIESGGSPIATYTDDFDGDTRNVTTPDIGADEFAGTPAAVVAINSVSASPTGSLCVATARTITANLTSGAADISTVVLNYSYNGVAQTPIAMTGGTLQGTSNWTATLPAATPTNAAVTWSVTATDPSATKNTAGASYTDDPQGGVTATLTANPATACAGAPVALSATLAGLTPPYCTPAMITTVSASGDYINNFTFGNITNNGSGDAANDYTYYSALTANVVANGTTPYSISLTAGGTTSTYTQQFRIWIDFNQNGVFEPTESVFNTTTATFSPTSATGTVTIPNTAYNGVTRMRVASRYNTVVGAGASCAGESQFGEFEDYNVSITGGQNNPNLVSSYTWSDASGVVGTGNPATINPVSTSNYSVVVAFVSGCTKTFSPVTVTVNPLPGAPASSNNPSVQCGNAVPEVAVADTNGFTTPTFKWYSAASGGTLLQSSTSTTYTTSISTTTNFYVSVTNPVTGCESARKMVTVNVNSPNALTASSVPATSVCLGTSVDLSVVQTGSTQAYTLTWTASPSTGSGVTAPTAGSLASPLTITPTATGTYVYTITGVDGSCTAINTVSLTVNPLPVITSATANPSTICSGSSTTLTGASVNATNTTTTVGTDNAATKINTTGVPYRIGTSLNYEVRNQYLVTASELSAAGLLAGNITSLAFTTTAVSGSGVMSNLTFKIANTTATALTSTFLTPTFTTVLTQATYAPVVGVNTHTFTTPFSWNGTSNIVVEVCGKLTTSGSGVTMATFTTATTSTVGNATSTGCTDGTGTTTTLSRPVMTFGGLVGTSQTASYTWQWNPGALSGSTVSVSPVNATASPVVISYMVTATNPTTLCSTTSAPVNVTVNPIPEVPVATDSVQCGLGVPKVFVTGTGGTFKWYSASTGGTLLQNGGSTYTTSINNTTTFYVSQTSLGCESARTPVTATVNTPPAFTVTPDQNVCNNGVTALTVTSNVGDFDSYTWAPVTNLFTNPAGTTPYTGGSASTVYFKSTTLGSALITATASNSVTQCVATTGTTMFVLPATASIAAPNTSFCQTGSTTLSLTPATGFATGSIQWQSSTDNITFNDISGANAVTYAVAGITSTTYYRVEIRNSVPAVCITSNVITLTINNPLVTGVVDGERCGTGAVGLSATGSAGSTIRWYQGLTGGIALASGNTFNTPSISTTTTYYVTAGVTAGTVTANTGAGASVTSTAGITPYSSNYEGAREQYLIRATELQAIGLAAGNITSLAFTVTTAGAGTFPQSGFTIKMAHTAATALASAYGTPTGSFTTVFGPVSQPAPAAGLSTHTFTTPFNWDGVSNVLVDICHDNDIAASCASCFSSNSTVAYTATAFNSCWGSYADNVASCGVQASNTISTFVNRPNMRLTGTSICESTPRTAVVATVNIAPVLTVSPNQVVCNNAVTALSVTSPVGDYDSYIWSPTANLYTNAAGTIAYTGTSATTVYVKNTTVGTVTYTCNALNTGTTCTGVATTDVLTQPGTVSASASTSTICFTGNTTLSLTPATGYAAGTIQWQISSDNITFTDIASANAATYAANGISSNTYYRAQIKNGSAVVCVTTNAVTITVNTPAVASSTPATRCGTGSVTLGATASSGATINWYAASTGGSVLGTGNSFVTPSIANTTNYYAEASIGGTLSTAGLTASGSYGTFSNPAVAGYGMQFNVTSGGVLTSVAGYPSAAGTINIQLYTDAGVAIGTAQSFTVTSGQIGTKVVFPVNLTLSSAGNYRLIETSSGILNRYNPYTGPGYPMSSGGSISLIATLTSAAGTPVTNLYYAFFDFQYQSGCQSARTMVTATVTPAPTFTISPSATVCNGEIVPLTVTSTIGNFDSYIWSPTTGLYTNALATTPYTGGNTATVYAKLTAAGTATFTCNALNTGTTCVNSATSTLTVLPATFTISATNTFLCVSGTTTLSIAPTTGYGTGEIQWQQSSDNVTFTDISSATGITYTSSTISTTTYYRAQIKNSAGVFCTNSNVVTVSVNNPLVLSSTPGSRCGVGSVELNATASAGATLKWYTAATGGTLAGTGSPFNTPVISADTAFFVSATVSSIAAGSGAVGTSTTTDLGSSIYRNGYGTGDFRHQLLYTASEMTAAGFGPGNITSLSVQVGTAGVGSYNNYTIRMANVANATLTSSFLTGASYTTVFNSTTYTPATSGTNTHTFSAPFNWDGTSSILIDICYNVSTLNSSTYLAVNPNTTGNLQLLGSTGACTATSGTLMTLRPVITFAGQVGTVCSSTPRTRVAATLSTAPAIVASTNDTIVCNGGSALLNVSSANPDYTYTWTPGNLTGASVTVNPTATTTYTVNANDAGTACAAVSTVVVKAQPAVVTVAASPAQVCVSGSSVLSLTPATGYAANTIQWQSSTDNVTFNNIASATGVTYTTPTITATTYYKALIKNGSGAICLQPSIAVVVNNPQVTSTTPATRCGTGTATLGATGTATATMTWYANSTGGAPLATGTSFTTPVISTTTNYYVAAVNGGGSATGGKPSTNGADGTNTGGAIYFTVNSAFNLNSVVMYPTTAGTSTFVLYAGSVTSGTALQTASYTFTGANAAGVTVPVNWALTPGTYSINMTNNGGNCWRDFSGGASVPATAFPYTIGPACTLTNSSLAGYYYFFYNWSISAGCESARSLVTATVTPAPAITVSSGNATICSGSSTTVSVSSANAGYTYTWTSNPAGFSQTGAGPLTVTPLVNTKYIVYATDNSGGPSAGCGRMDSVAITTTTNPIVLTATATPPTLCAGGNTQLQASATAAAYSLSSITYSLKSPVSPTTVTPWTNTDSDDGSNGPISIPFNFNYYGTSYNQLYAGTNGYISFSSLASVSAANLRTAQSFPSTTTPNNTIALGMSDLWVSGATVSYFTTGTAPNRVFVVSFNAVPFYYFDDFDFVDATTGSVNGQIQLYEGFQYYRNTCYGDKPWFVVS